MWRVGARLWIAAVVAASLLLVPATAGAAVTIGSDLSTSANAGSGCAAQPCTFVSFTIPGRTTASPIDGVVTRWRIRGPAGSGQLALRVIRPAGGNTFVGAGTSATVAVPVVPELQTFSTQLPIRAGDFVGLNVPFGAQDPSGMIRTTPGATRSIFEPALPDGGPAATPLGPFDNLELLYNADVEPDCDADGLGDETQDGDISSCSPPPPPPPDTAAPETILTQIPKNKVKTFSRRADVLFEFVSSEAGSSFQCRFNKGEFQPCGSPHVLKAKAKRRKAKKHHFEVRAIDAAGNVDPTPATDDFKVKRKRG